MRSTASRLRARKQELSELMTREMGKLIHSAHAEIEKCAWVCEYFAENTERFLADEPVETDASRSYVTFNPIGVVLAVMPCSRAMRSEANGSRQPNSRPVTARSTLSSNRIHGCHLGA